jgi:UDP-GlcNAc3NAcA epimerase
MHGRGHTLKQMSPGSRRVMISTRRRGASRKGCTPSTGTIVSIVGTRPQLIKEAVLSARLRRELGLEQIRVDTGQHYDDAMAGIFYRELGLGPPKYNCDVGSDTHGRQTALMLERLEAILVRLSPTLVLVYGDTNSTLAGTLAAAKLRIPIAHVEAGLRSFDRKMPEEINRVVTDQLSDLLFATNSPAVSNLVREGVARSRIRLTGDIMYDAALVYAEKAETESSILERLQLVSQKYVLATVHRAENTDAPARLRAIFEALRHVSRHIPVIVPLHPRTSAALERAGVAEDVQQRLRLIGPLGYLDMVRLERNARLIATDSGGVQREAYFYRVPCVTLRAQTEWTELVESHWSTLAVGEEPSEIARTIIESLDKMGDKQVDFGDGNAAGIICDALASFIKDRPKPSW